MTKLSPRLEVRIKTSTHGMFPQVATISEANRFQVLAPVEDNSYIYYFARIFLKRYTRVLEDMINYLLGVTGGPRRPEIWDITWLLNIPWAISTSSVNIQEYQVMKN